MIIHIPDPDPGRCKSWRNDNPNWTPLRCLLYEDTPHRCIFEEPKPLSSPATISGSYITQRSPQPWKSPLDQSQSKKEREQRMTEQIASASDRTHLVLLLDRSGSMSSIKDDMEPAMNKFIAEQKDQPGKCRVTFARFDDDYEVVHNAVKIKDIPKLALEPRGMTALYDAMGKVMTEARSYIAGLPAAKHPRYKLMVVVTDGGENHSQTWRRDGVFELVKKMEAEGWKFTYIGANQDAIATGTDMGFAAASSMTYKGTRAGITNTFNTVSTNTSLLRSASVADYAYSSSDRADAVAEDEDQTAPSTS